MFIRKRGNHHELIETYREGGKVNQRRIASLHDCDNITDALEYWRWKLKFQHMVGERFRGSYPRRWTAEQRKQGAERHRHRWARDVKKYEQVIATLEAVVSSGDPQRRNDTTCELRGNRYAITPELVLRLHAQETIDEVRARWDKHCGEYGLEPSDWGRQVVAPNVAGRRGEPVMMRLFDIATDQPKFPIVTTRLKLTKSHGCACSYPSTERCYALDTIKEGMVGKS